jgi:hypothetical protein
LIDTRWVSIKSEKQQLRRIPQGLLGGSIAYNSSLPNQPKRPFGLFNFGVADAPFFGDGSPL